MAPENDLDAEELPEVNPMSPAVSSLPAAAATTSAGRCPFHDGAATLDAFLAELDPRDHELFDAALDLRSLFANGQDAGACAAQLFHIRELLGERHYLAFYRVRCWARRALQVQVRAVRGEPWLTREFPLDGGRLDEVINAALAGLACDGVIPAAAHARFVFAV
jgi:hypothetical protein